jgi:molybdenum cofactor cytidylyltransferase
MRIDGVILAAGLSSRMAQPKPLLEVGTETFLERVASILKSAGCEQVHAVVNEMADWAPALAAAAGVTLLTNDRPESEQVDSLRLVLERIDAEVDAVLVLPVDLPLVSDATARAIVDAFRQSPTPLVLPFHNGVAGHPILIGRELFAAVLQEPLEEGIRSLVMEHSRHMREVRVSDPGILIDIDTPDDYWRYVQRK